MGYRDILQEVSFSPVMGQYLTFLQSKSFAESGTYPDENYARELMQLFTIGLFKLDQNGTALHGSNGELIPTYTNENIMDFARVWTGFDVQAFRTNLEARRGLRSRNFIDPM